jgi:hypothetical protein
MCKIKFKYYSSDIPICARQAFEAEANRIYATVRDALNCSQSYILVYSSVSERQVIGILITDELTELMVECQGIATVIEHEMV